MSTEAWNNNLTVFVNGVKKVVRSPDPRQTLLTFLRTEVGLTGTKLGCGEGGCGACTVMISHYNQKEKKVEHINVNACLTPVCGMDQMAITTIEGIGGMKDGLHPVQERIATMHGSQCGFCTPGIVMSVYTQFRRNPNSTPQQIEESLDGNLCRCTGYRPILDAAKSLSNQKGCCGGGGNSGGCCGGNKQAQDDDCCSKKKKESCCGGGSNGGCPCKEGATEEKDVNEFNEKKVTNKTEKVIATLKSYTEVALESGLTEPIFPSVLQKAPARPLHYVYDNYSWYQPVTLASMHHLKQQYPHAKIIVGNTEVGIETKFKQFDFPIFINAAHVPELKQMEITSYGSDKGLLIGGSVTLNHLREYVHNLKHDKSVESHEIRGLAAVSHMLHWFASNQIRNVASLAGNIVTASPISDVNPMLGATKAVIKLSSDGGNMRYVPVSEFFLGYRKVDIKPNEILESVFIPFTDRLEFVVPFKQARRREDDISIVTAGINIKLAIEGEGSDNCKFIIDDATMSFGGMAAITTQTVKTCDALRGKEWKQEAIEEAIAVLRQELSLPVNVPGGQAEYRMSLAMSFLFKAFYIVSGELKTYLDSADGLKFFAAETRPKLPAIPDSEMESASANFITTPKALSRGEQMYAVRRGGLSVNDSNIAGNDPEAVRAPVGEPLMHKSATVQVSGEALYTGDIPLPASAVHAALVTSTRAHARILSIDPSEAEASEGFVAFYTAKDIPGSNHIGAVIKDEEVFASEIVKHYNAVIGVVIGTTHEIALRLAQRIKIEYEDLPAIISIEDAIAAGSYFQDNHIISNGDLEGEEKTADVVVEGEIRVGGQEHFYLETNCSVVIPSENNHLEIFSSTQNLTKTQNFCASVTGLPANHVVARCKRLGGGFGGKETRSVFIACAAAVAAHHLGRPVSINIERDLDMSITGQRHAFLIKYKAGAMNDGQLKFLDATLYANGGYSLDLTQAVMDRALFHSDNSYKWPALRVVGKPCKTNQSSHTAYRGFGGPQGLMVAESALLHLSSKLPHIPLYKLREMNFYKNGDKTHFGQELVQFYVPKLWEEAKVRSNYFERVEKINEFNGNNKYKKRGIEILPTKYGINFTAKFMNQGSALVHVYQDGSVLVSHGGLEMGQGLHTKVIQVAAQKFGIPDSMVHIIESSTDCVANASPTAASMSTDLYGMACLNACEKIIERLEPIRQQLLATPEFQNCDPVKFWKTLIIRSFFERIELSAYGYYVMPNDRCGYNWDATVTDNSERGQPFNYFTQGVAVSEVEIDCLTGDSKVIRADVFMDLGKSVNPAIDIGQIEGAFTQGYGWSTMEEVVWGDNDHKWVCTGQLFTRGPGTYKIPSFNDCPQDFRVHLMDTENPFAVHSSKAVGEPPFFLGSCPFFAIKNAIMSFREEHDVNGFYQLNLPATSERIRMGCCDKITTLASENAAFFQARGSW